MATLTYALNYEEAQVLQEQRMVLSSPVNGKRKVSAALLSPPTSNPSSKGSVGSASSKSSASVRIRPFDPSTKDAFDLPESTESVSALEFLGFTQKVSLSIFARWVGRPDPQNNPDVLFQYALGELWRLSLPPLKDLPPMQAMAGLGISDELQECLTDPRFSQLFRSQTLSYWLTDTMNIRYSTLNTLLERLKSRAVRTIATRKERKRPRIAGVFESFASSSTSQPPTTTASSNISSEEEVLPSTYTAVQSVPQALPDHYTLYKCKATSDMDGDVFIREDGSVNMNSIQTYKGEDFNHRRIAWYWAKEEAAAEQYRLWAASRSQYSTTWMISIQVPKTFMDSLRKQQLWFSPDWKEYVWYCRKGGSAGDPPAKFDRLWKNGQAQLVEGHICGRAPAVIPRIKKEELQEKISEGDVLVVGGRKATQLCFMDEEAVERLGIAIRGKIFIDMYPAAVGPQKEV